MKTITMIFRGLLGLALLILLIASLQLWVAPAYATSKAPPPVAVEQEQKQKQGQQQKANSSVGDIDIGGDTYVAPDIPVSTALSQQSWSDIRCDKIIGFAGQGNNAGVSFGFPVPDWMSREKRDCKKIRAASWLKTKGWQRAEVTARCSTREMQELFSGPVKGQAKRTAVCVNRLLGEDESEARIDQLEKRLDEQQRRFEQVLRDNSSDPK